MSIGDGNALPMGSWQLHLYNLLRVTGERSTIRSEENYDVPATN